MTKIFAHRGASAMAPENTLPAFELAMQQQADGIELDVQLTKDGEVVVIHDEDIKRVSGHTGSVCEYTLQQLQSFSFHNHMQEYQGVQIPTLAQVLELVRPSGMEVNIELKTSIFWYPKIEEKVAQIVRDAGMEERVIYSSFNHYSVQKMRRLSPAAETAYLYSDVTLNVELYAKNSGVDGLHPPIWQLNMADFLQRYEESGLKIRVWTVDEEEYIRVCLEHGLEAIITNNPKKALQIRKEMMGC